MHGAQHACNKLVDAVAFLYQRNEGGDTALIVSNMTEMRKNQLLELLNLILERHQVGNRLVTLIGVVDSLQTEVLFVLERAVEFGVLLVERKLGQEVIDVFSNQGAVSSHSLSAHSAVQAVDPASLSHSLPQSIGMPFLEDFVYSNQSLISLDLIGKNGLAAKQHRQRISPTSVIFTYTFIPAQKAWEDRWSHVYTMQLRTCFRFGAVSSGFVAFLMLIANSWSVLTKCQCTSTTKHSEALA